MDSKNFFLYYDKPCKFKLRSGKEVYGVIWKDKTSAGDNHFFASSGDYHAIKHSQNSLIKTSVNIDDVVSAEMLDGLVPGKDMFK